MPNKVTSKAGVVVEAHVVSEDEGQLTATVAGGGHETLLVGDALITFKGKQHKLVAPLYRALFGADADTKAEPTKAESSEPAAAPPPAPTKAGKGGQHESHTKG